MYNETITFLLCRIYDDKLLNRHLYVLRLAASLLLKHAEKRLWCNPSFALAPSIHSAIPTTCINALGMSISMYPASRLGEMRRILVHRIMKICPTVDKPTNTLQDQFKCDTISQERAVAIFKLQQFLYIDDHRQSHRQLIEW